MVSNKWDFSAGVLHRPKLQVKNGDTNKLPDASSQERTKSGFPSTTIIDVLNFVLGITQTGTR